MNSQIKSNPELIASLRIVDKDANDQSVGDKITGIQVMQDDGHPDGYVQIDVRDFRRGDNLVIEIELPELMSALSLATLNATRDDA